VNTNPQWVVTPREKTKYCVLRRELSLKSMSIEMVIKINNYVGLEQEVHRAQ